MHSNATTDLANEGGGRLLPARRIWERYGVCSRTLDRWLGNAEIGFPRPIVLNSRRYWRQDDIEAWERRRAAARVGEAA